MTTRSDPASTGRLTLARPVPDDIAALYAICSDPRVWWHFPSLRHTAPEQTAVMVGLWQRGWDDLGLGVWTVRRSDDGRVIGYGGASDLGGAAWNLGYRISADEQGKGFATELARAGLTAAHEADPEKPVIAYLLAHNEPSANVAKKIGLELVDSGPDAGNPDRSAVRLVYADRALTPAQLAAARR